VKDSDDVLIYFQLTDSQISISVPQKNNHFSQSLCIAISFIYCKHFSCTILSIILTIPLKNSTFLFPHLAKVYWSGFCLRVFTGGLELAHCQMSYRLVKWDFERSKCKLFGRFGYTYRCCQYCCSIRVCRQIRTNVFICSNHLYIAVPYKIISLYHYFYTPIFILVSLCSTYTKLWLFAEPPSILDNQNVESVDEFMLFVSQKDRVETVEASWYVSQFS